jgi:hypothetical protein
MVDFKGVYYDARCLLQHTDPYKEGEPLRVYQAEAADRSLPPDGLRQILTRSLYPPTTSIFIVPFAMLPWGPAHLLWMTLTVGSFLLAALLMWNVTGSSAPGLSAVLICLILANSEVLVAFGNAAGISVSLCVVAVWCFLRERFALAGVLCLAVSLAIKPHDAGLVWLYFLLAGAVYRKRALQTLVIVAVLGVPALLWVTHIAPGWVQEWQSNLAAYSARGGLNNPGPAAVTARSTVMVIDLQSVISLFRDDPQFYNPASYLVCGALLLAGAVRTIKSRISQARAWIALAAVAPLTMLVTYHRPCDAKLLLLAVPACALLWAEGRPARWVALLLTTAGIVLTGDLPLAILVGLTRNLSFSATSLSGQMLTVVLMRPVPLILLAMGIFYLWIYLRRDLAKLAAPEPGETGETPLAPTRA